MADAEFWTDRTKAETKAKELADIKRELDRWNGIEKEFSSFVTEKKVYRPHVTLSKIKKQKWLALPEKPVLKEKLHLMESIDTVCVFESLSLDGKRRYEPIDTFSLL